MNINIDSKTISKQIEASKLKQKVIITAAVLLVVVVAWFILDYITRREPTIDESFTSLVAPFRFNINQEVLDQLKTRERYTEAELVEFPIYLVDETALARGNSLTVTELGEEPPADDNFVPVGEEGDEGTDTPEPPVGEVPENIQTDTGGDDFFQEV